VSNIYFALTEAFNATERVVALASGQAVVYYRVAIMSKDGDWVIRETAESCATVLEELERRGAHYRPGAPLDIRWLSGGWSSHFEFTDDRQRRVRCDFLSRPPRASREAVQRLFAPTMSASGMHVVDLDTLIAMKQTQRAKDYPVIGALATQLPPEREIELTTDPDRIIALAATVGRSAGRPVARLAGAGADRHAVVVALAEEIDGLQQADRHRMAAYEAAAQPYIEACRAAGIHAIPLRQAHDRMVTIAERLLPRTPLQGFSDADAQ
jgi:predicted regulator of Ras-like GTPase activity (Roadblock/LC7/MglB family)